MTSFDLVLVLCRLTVQDPEFWKGLQPVTFGPLPRLQSQVTVIGYPCAQPAGTLFMICSPFQHCTWSELCACD